MVCVGISQHLFNVKPNVYDLELLGYVCRLYPSVPTTFRQPINDDVVNGYFIPAGTIMNIQMGAMAR